MTTSPLRKRNLRTVGLLAGLFMLPLALSFVLYFSGWRPAGQSIYGRLIDPPRPLPSIALRERSATAAGRVFPELWTLVYVGDGACASDCQHALYVIRQTRLLLNQDMTRVGRVFLATATCCNDAFLRREHPGLSVFDASGSDAGALLQTFPTAGRATSIFVVDPLGNLMLREDANADPKGLLEDLRKLLRLSSIG